jgi:hypothetical protein
MIDTSVICTVFSRLCLLWRDLQMCLLLLLQSSLLHTRNRINYSSMPLLNFNTLPLVQYLTASQLYVL